MPVPTILVAEDDSAIAESVRRLLEAEGYRVAVADNGQEAVDWLAEHTPDLIIADVMMPRMNGYQLYQRVRENPDWKWIPFIFLTARADAEDVRYGKVLGADDYLSKPIDPADLLAAVAGRLARFEQLTQDAPSPAPTPAPSGQRQIGDLRIDFSRYSVHYAGQPIKLTPTEFNILRRLVVAGDAVVSYDDLRDARDPDIDEREAARLLRYHVRNIRQKFEAAGAKDLIANVRGVGYRLNA